MDTTDYSNAPVSIGELRSDRSRKASDWSPRDVLVHLLRRMDAGEVKPDALVVLYRHETKDGGTYTGYSCATPDIQVTMGVIEVGKAEILRDAFTGGRR